MIELLNHTIGPNDPQWHDVRRAGIGASEIAAVMGISPWESAFSLHWRKRQRWSDGENKQERRGRRMEQLVADEFADAHPEFVVQPAGLFQHPARPWMLASPDRMLFRSDVHEPACPHSEPGADPDLLCVCMPPQWGEAAEVLECKTAVHRDGWGDEGTDEVPVHYRAQCLQQVEVTGVARCRLAVMFVPGWDLREYVIDRDPDDIAAMVAAGDEFMYNLAAGRAPDLDWTPATTRTLKLLHPSVEDRDIEIPAVLAGEYDDARTSVKAAEERKSLAENQIRALIGEGRRAMCAGQPVATRSVYEMSRIDVKALRADQPEIAGKYSVTSIVDKLMPARRKKDPK